jgi:hypothetical protein
MSSPVNETLEILKIIVPAVSSFLGVITAGFIGYYASSKSQEKSHKNIIEIEKVKRFSDKIVFSVDTIMKILITKLKNTNFDMTIEEKQHLIELSLWTPKDISDKIQLLVGESNDPNDVANDIINSIREHAGIE